MSNFDGNYTTEGEEFYTSTSPYITDQGFNSREELTHWVQNTGRSLGYVIVTQRSKKDSSGFVNKVTFMCDRSGDYIATGTSRVTGTKKINCPFQLIGKYVYEYNCWALRVVCDQHNHPPAQYLEGHAFARRLSNDEYRLVDDLTRMNVVPRHILSTIKRQDKNNVSILKNIYNVRSKIRMEEHAGRSPMQVLMSLLQLNRYVYECFTNDLNELEALFFVHPTSLDIWRAFPHVLLIDATYKTNKYKMPFVEIVGVTSTNKTFCIAFAFIDKEREVNYTWVLTRLKLTLEDCMHPRVIVTDRELALINACHQVFPNATQLLCRWHIGQNIYKKCRRRVRSKRDWESFNSLWELLENSPTYRSYEENYTNLQSMLKKYPGVLKYVETVWLNNYKEMFVSAWIDQSLNFGNRTTNRVESQHSKLKKYLESPNYTLEKFVHCIDQIVKLQLTAIQQSFEKSRIIRYTNHNVPCFNLLRGLVSHNALDLMLGELQRSKGLEFDSSNCGSQLRHSCGLPCACILSVYINSGECISLDSIDIFWRKLDISPTTYAQNDDICCDGEVEGFKENFNKQSKAGKRSLLRKLKDLFDASATTLKEPIVQKNTCGRPRKQQQKDTRGRSKKSAAPISQDPRRHSYSNAADFVGSGLNNQPARHSSYVVGANKEPTGYSSYFNFQTCYSHPLMSEMPSIFHPYITRIQNVMSDGNCGFRAIAVCLGYDEDQWLNIRLQLLDELRNGYHTYIHVFNTYLNELYQSLYCSDSPAPQENWMIMPSTAVLIANRFGVIVHCISIQGSMTCFPLWRGPREFQQHRTFTIAHVYGNHFVMVQLQGEYPMPPITPYWSYYKAPNAAEWQTMYAPRLELFTNIKACNSEKEFIDVEN